MGKSDSYYVRPMIDIKGDKVIHNGLPVRLVMRRNGVISVGCSDVTVAALRHLLEVYQREFPAAADERVLQP